MTLITSAAAQPEPSESAGGGRVTPPSLDAEAYPAFRDYPVPTLAAATATPAPPAQVFAGGGEQLTGDDAPSLAPTTSPNPAPGESPPDSAPSSTSPPTAARPDDSPGKGADPPARTPAEPSAPAPTEPSAPEPAEPSAPEPEPSAPEPADPPRVDDLTDHLAALVAAWAERPSSPVGREISWDEAVRAGLWWAVVETCNDDHPDLMADCLGVADEIVAEMELSPVEPARWTKLMAEGRDAGYRLALVAMDRLEAHPDPEPDAPAELPVLPSGPLLPLP